MARKRYKPEQIIRKLREAEVAQAEGKTVPRTARLRLDALAADLDPDIARSQYEGTRARVAAGKASEAAPRSLATE